MASPLFDLNESNSSNESPRINSFEALSNIQGSGVKIEIKPIAIAINPIKIIGAQMKL